MNLVEPLVAELQHEAEGTRTMLQKIPFEKTGWQPHEKSMTLGRLAAHISEIPGWLHDTILQDEMDFAKMDFTHKPLENKEDLLNAFDDAMNKGMSALWKATNEILLSEWTLRHGEQVFFRMQRIGVVRGMILNHVVHHRGQLSVYLRMLNIPVPGMYGPSADDMMM